MDVRRGDVILVHLDPTRGREMRKTRPALVVSPDEMNRTLSTLIVAPMTTGGKSWPTRVRCRFRGTDGHVALDQVRAIDRERVAKRLGRIHATTHDAVLERLQEMFAK